MASGDVVIPKFAWTFTHGDFQLFATGNILAASQLLSIDNRAYFGSQILDGYRGPARQVVRMSILDGSNGNGKMLSRNSRMRYSQLASWCGLESGFASRRVDSVRSTHAPRRFYQRDRFCLAEATFAGLDREHQLAFSRASRG